MSASAGVDVGGTFTDITIADPETGRVTVAKVPSTANQADGLVHGLHEAGVSFEELATLVHGTTVATNAILERRGASVALVTTAGFRDVLELRRRDRPHTYGLTSNYTPLTPRAHCFEITERITSTGAVSTSMTETDIARLADELAAGEFDAVAVCLLNAYANPEHERLLGDALRDRLPGTPVSLSHELAAEAGEFERASTVTVNAYVQPKMRDYLGSVRDQLRSAGFGHEMQVMQSSGGLMPVSRAIAEPARTALSGPAAGTVAAAAIAREAGFPDVISADMGGTSFDVALIPGGTPAVSTLTQLDFGIPLKLPMVDIHTIGAGGGSIASVDRGGVLQVGPRSAGAIPGPACYGKGGTEPTVTDANVVLGRLPSGGALGTGGGLSLDYSAAEHAVRVHVADPLGLSTEHAALSIVAVANARMAGAIRTVSVDAGADPRKFALVGFGGAGPLHAVELAREIGCAQVVLPPRPGLACALGCLVADARVDFTHSVEDVVEHLDAATVEKVLAGHAQRGTEQLRTEGLSDDVVVTHWAEMSYQKQLHTVSVELGDTASGWDVDRLTSVFIDAYRAQYGGMLRSAAARLVNLRTTVIGRRPVPPLAITDESERPEQYRRVVFATGAVDTPVVGRSSLHAGETVNGPLVVEQSDTTILVPPGTRVLAHESGSLVVEVQA
ncbi:hydantoinase/oxoprolinase [Saccharomonospora sp. CUA-673]|uniref:hydantoinase/oxoprolinase family protein n=1 Tax=Saccharomonospora sp. CUA-673 TaxID=1904969 RepID=UPI00095929CA|nr:hydantoinase/oxoprolinase family protein [Saccharomonospora sp. CUA-673]OLT42361.1 hydantoinase/oxoprolinase [Saccharomonospora sp. CUA-673]